MKTEYEVRILEINKEEIVEKLEKLGAKKIGEFHQQRYVYDLVPKIDGCWIRLRTNGKKTTLTYKCIEAKTIDGTKEIEVEVSDFEKTNLLLKQMGYESKGFQENIRIQYILDNVEIDIDTWPHLPTWMEIEGDSEEEVETIINKLEINKEKLSTLDVESLYHFYGYKEVKDLKFEGE